MISILDLKIIDYLQNGSILGSETAPEIHHQDDIHPMYLNSSESIDKDVEVSSCPLASATVNKVLKCRR